MARLLGATTIRVVMGSYSGYYYEQEAQAIPLLGRDPAQTDRNEVVQSSAKQSKVCEFECYAADATERDALVNKLFTQTTHDDGTGEAVRNVNVISVKPRIEFWAGGSPSWIVAIKLRER